MQLSESQTEQIRLSNTAIKKRSSINIITASKSLGCQMGIGERATKMIKNGFQHLLFVYYCGKIPNSAKVLERDNLRYNKKSMFRSGGWMMLTR